jgi:hypothetical protein
MKMLMKTADISNESRPLKVSQGWVDCLLTEFFNQVSENPSITHRPFQKSGIKISFFSRVIMKNSMASH